MLPSEVYVVYNSKDDTILSVHSTRGFATLARRDVINDTLSNMKEFLTSEDYQKLDMRYVIGTLEEAVQWMVSPDGPPDDDDDTKQPKPGLSELYSRLDILY